MARSPPTSKYFVRVARLRIETAIVEVEAANDEEAQQMAMREAVQLPEEAWAAEEFDHATYCPQIDVMVTGGDFDPPIKLDRGHAFDLLAEAETRYLLLKTSSDQDEGDLVLQPWFNVDQPDLLVSDLTRDWIASLQSQGLTHMSERLDDLAAGSPPKPSDRIIFSAPKQRKPPGEET